MTRGQQLLVIVMLPFASLLLLPLLQKPECIVSVPFVHSYVSGWESP